MCMTSDPYAAGYTFARSAFTGGGGAPLGTKRPYVRYIYTDSEIIVLTRWGSLRLAPIIYNKEKVNTPIEVFHKFHGCYT